MRGHLWLGLITLPLILFHAGFAFRGPLTFVLMMLFFVVWLSGILGAVLQHYLPALITSDVPLETIYEEIPHVRQQLRDEADQHRWNWKPSKPSTTTKFVSGKRTKLPFGLFWRLPSSARLYRWRTSSVPRVVFQALRHALPAVLHPALGDIESICEEERQLIRQRRMYHWLDVWLLVPVPLSLVLLVWGGVHAIVALRY